ncbi:hypothetical protein Tco_0995612 [Tanacetum coccineum]
MLMDEKVNSSQKVWESKPVIPQPELSKSVNLSRLGQESKPKVMKAKVKPFPPCTHCGFNDHLPDDCLGVSCNSCRSIVHSTTDHRDFDHFKRGEKLQAAKAKEPTKSLLCQRVELSTMDAKQNSCLEVGRMLHGSKKPAIRNLECLQSEFEQPLAGPMRAPPVGGAVQWAFLGCVGVTGAFVGS